MVMAASGRVRTLVPFFIPGEDNTVNETLSTFPTDDFVKRSRASKRRSAPAGQYSNDVVSVNIRKWDSSEGFFRDAVHVIEDFHNSASTYKSSSIKSRKTSNLDVSSSSPSLGRTPEKTSVPKPTQMSMNFSPLPSSSPSPAKATPARPPRHQTPSFVNGGSLSTSPTRTSIAASSPQLLTPANIRKAQMKTRHSSIMSLPPSPLSAHVNSKLPSVSSPAIVAVPPPIIDTPQQRPTGPVSLDVSIGTLSSSSRRSTVKSPSQFRSKSTLESSPELHRRPWAGSSFDTASPAPAFIPIPAFKTATSLSSSIARRLSDVDDFHPEQELMKFASVLRL